MKTRYMHGKKLGGFFCDKCGFYTDGTVIRERYRWSVRADCGHMLQRGYVLPVDELQRRGYVNYETKRDPRAVITEDTIREATRKKWREETFHYISKSPYCLISGEVHTNPLFGISEKKLDSQKTQVVLELLQAIYDYGNLQNLQRNLEKGTVVKRDIAPELKMRYKHSNE